MCSSDLVDGGDVVQLYIKEIGAKNQPLHALKRFKKIELKQGEKQTVHFTLNADDFAHVNEQGEKELLPNTEFEVFAGNCQPDLRSEQLTGSKPLKAVVTWQGLA